MIDNAIGGDLVGRCSKVLFVFIPGLCSYLMGRRVGRGGEREREKKIIQRRGERGEVH